MAGKENLTSFLEGEIRMVLVGKTGVGKSETGNTICGARREEQIFTAKIGASSITKTCKQHSFNRFGHDLQLVDVPGFCDTSGSDKDVKKEIIKCVVMSSPGIHAILFIVRIGRITEEDTNTLERFLQCFGKEAKRFVIVVFTGKDDLDREGTTLENYIGDFPPSLKQFLYETNLRIIAVNNSGTDEEKEKFTKDLIEKVDKMVNEQNGQCYTNEMYEKCEADLREAEKKEKLEGKRQEEFEKRLEQEAAAFKEQVQSQRHKIQKMEKQLEKERMSREKDQEDQLKERLKALELRAKNEEENKRREEEEKKRQAEQKETEENTRRELEMMKDFQRKQTEIYKKKIRELQLEEARKQIREKVEKDDTSYFGQFVEWCGSWFQ